MSASTHPNEPIGPRSGAAALLASLLWGGNSVFIKVGLAGMPPTAMAGARFLLGALTVVAGALVLGVSLRLPASAWRGLAGLAAVFTLQIYLLNQGTNFTTASRSTVLMSAYPFFTALFAHFFLPGDRLSATKMVGLTLAFAGVVLIFADTLNLGRGDYLWGDAMVLASAVLLGVRHIVLKRLVGGLHPYQVLFWQATLSLPAFALISAVWESEAAYSFDAWVVGALLYQGVVVAGLCFIIWVFLLQRHSASRLGVFGFATPIFGVWLSVALLGEGLSPGLVASAALVAAGIVVVNREPEPD